MRIYEQEQRKHTATGFWLQRHRPPLCRCRPAAAQGDQQALTGCHPEAGEEPWVISRAPMPCIASQVQPASWPAPDQRRTHQTLHPLSSTRPELATGCCQGSGLGCLCSGAAMPWHPLSEFDRDRVERGRRLLQESEDHRGSRDLQVWCSARRCTLPQLAAALSVSTCPGACLPCLPRGRSCSWRAWI